MNAELKRYGDTSGLVARDYYRQYSGLVVGGMRIIYVNGAHRQYVDEHWRQEAFDICHAGPRAFDLVYFPLIRTRGRFRFNDGGFPTSTH